MHSTIYEFSEQPISESRRATIDSLPEWFFQTVADSAADTDEITRAVQIRCLEQHFGDLCIRDGDQLRLVHDFKARYFRNSYPYFMAAVRALAKASYDMFSGIMPAPAFHAALNSVTESYADRFGFYVYDSDHAELLPMDAWLRTADCRLPDTDESPLTFTIVDKRYFTLRSCFFQKVVPLELDFSLVLPLKLVQQLVLKSNF